MPEPTPEKKWKELKRLRKKHADVVNNEELNKVANYYKDSINNDGPLKEEPIRERTKEEMTAIAKTLFSKLD
ncbi:MAG: hypothetical protein WCJ57_03135 [Candidatus Falkowbacteria bacterium]